MSSGKPGRPALPSAAVILVIRIQIAAFLLQFCFRYKYGYFVRFLFVLFEQTENTIKISQQEIVLCVEVLVTDFRPEGQHTDFDHFVIF